MPVGVVHTFESVQVEHHHADLGVVAPRRVYRLTEAVEEQRAVGQLRQRVMQRAMRERGFEAVAFREVAYDRHGVFAGRPKRDLDRNTSAVLASQSEVAVGSTHQPRDTACVETAPVSSMCRAQAGGEQDLDLATDQLLAPVTG